MNSAANTTNQLTNAQIKEMAEEAGRGAAMRAANRGWGVLEQARCYDEAYQACLADYPEAA